MPSSRAEVAQSLRVARTLRIGDVVLVPVERLRVAACRGFPGAFVHGSAELRAVVVEEGGRRRALGPAGEPLPLSALLEEVPDLEDALRRARA